MDSDTAGTYRPDVGRCPRYKVVGQTLVVDDSQLTSLDRHHREVGQRLAREESTGPALVVMQLPELEGLPCLAGH